MSKAEHVELVRYLDAPRGETLGYLAAWPKGGALWCGEISRQLLRDEPRQVREALGNDIGWFLAERRSTACRGFKLLAKVASEEIGLRLLRDAVYARLNAEGDVSPLLSIARDDRVLGPDFPLHFERGQSAVADYGVG